MSDDKKPTPGQVLQRNLNPLLETDQDVQSMMVIPHTGRSRLGSDLIKNFKVKTQEGKVSDRVSLDVWDVRSSITSDIRLSNLKPTQEPYARFCLKMQLFCLDNGLFKAAASANAMLVAVVEPGLGRNMALRNNLQEVRNKSESLIVENKPEQKKFLNGILG